MAWYLLGVTPATSIGVIFLLFDGRYWLFPDWYGLMGTAYTRSWKQAISRAQQAGIIGFELLEKFCLIDLK